VCFLGVLLRTHHAPQRDLCVRQVDLIPEAAENSIVIFKKFDEERNDLVVTVR